MVMEQKIGLWKVGSRIGKENGPKNLWNPPVFGMGCMEIVQKYGLQHFFMIVDREISLPDTIQWYCTFSRGKGPKKTE